MSEMKFYNIHEQTKYQISISCPESLEDLSDVFVTQEELSDMGVAYFPRSNNPTRLLMKSLIQHELEEWAKKLDASGKKTLRIEDDDLLDIIKEGYMSDFLPDGEYGRHGDRICYARRYKRTKKKPTKTDVRNFWTYYFPQAFREKFGCWPPHIPTYERHLTMFRAFKEILGWRAVYARFKGSSDAKFLRQIWNNPEEYMS